MGKDAQRCGQSFQTTSLPEKTSRPSRVAFGVAYPDTPGGDTHLMSTILRHKALLHPLILGHPLPLQGKLRNFLQDNAVAPHLSGKQRAMVGNNSCLMVKPELQRRPAEHSHIYTASPEHLLISHCEESRHTTHCSPGS